MVETGATQRSGASHGSAGAGQDGVVVRGVPCLYRVVEGWGCAGLVLSRMEGTDLMRYMRSECGEIGTDVRGKRLRVGVCPLPLSRGLPAADLAGLSASLVASLTALHCIGVYSRDVKPDNCIVTRTQMPAESGSGQAGGKSTGGSEGHAAASNGSRAAGGADSDSDPSEGGRETPPSRVTSVSESAVGD